MKKCLILFLIFVAVLFIAALTDKNSESVKNITEFEKQHIALTE